MNVDCVIFDLDATLVNLGGFVDWRSAQERVAEAYLECGCTEAVVRRCCREGLFDMLNMMWDELYATLPRDEAEHIQAKAYAVLDTYEARAACRCQLISGCLEALQWLRGFDVRMGVVTSNSQEVAERILEANELRGFFAAVVGRTPKLRMKPHPDQLLACFDVLGVGPCRGVVVGDSVRDVKAAKAVGAYAVAVPAYFTEREALVEAGVDEIIDCLDDISDVLSTLLSEAR